MNIDFAMKWSVVFDSFNYLSVLAEVGLDDSMIAR